MTLTLQIRPVRPDNAGRLVELHARCSEQARYFRFHAAEPITFDGRSYAVGLS